MPTGRDGRTTLTPWTYGRSANSLAIAQRFAIVGELPVGVHNLAVELLQKLLNDEIKTQSKKNLVLSRSFSEMLEKTIRKYQNRTIEAAQVILELIELAKEMREAKSRGEKLGLNEDEEAFYDALGINDSVVQVLGDETLKTIAR